MSTCHILSYVLSIVMCSVYCHVMCHAPSLCVVMPPLTSDDVMSLSLPSLLLWLKDLTRVTLAPGNTLPHPHDDHQHQQPQLLVAVPQSPAYIHNRLLFPQPDACPEMRGKIHRKVLRYFFPRVLCWCHKSMRACYQDSLTNEGLGTYSLTILIDLGHDLGYHKLT